MELNEHSTEHSAELTAQNANKTGTTAEQPGEQQSASENNQEQPITESSLPVYQSVRRQFKPITARVRENTEPFFQMVSEIESKHNLSTADAFERAISELLDVQKRVSEHGSQVAALRAEVLSQKTEIERLLKLTETDQGHRLRDNEFIVEVPDKMLKLLRKIRDNRFSDHDTKARYKLTEPETIGQLLVNCIRTQEILFDYNCCFYTGLTREQLESHREARG